MGPVGSDWGAGQEECPQSGTWGSCLNDCDVREAREEGYSGRRSAQSPGVEAAGWVAAVSGQPLSAYPGLLPSLPASPSCGKERGPARSGGEGAGGGRPRGFL